jgi:glycosyltransferase involved in cell wall biosynthesis
MRIALVVQNGSPLSPGALKQPGSQAASVAAHARGLAALGHRVTIYARRDSRALPGSAILAPRVTVEHVAAGPLAPLSTGDLAANVAPFGDYLAQRWRRNPPGLVHAYYWTSGLAALAAARGGDVPLVQTFGTLGVAERLHGSGGDAGSARIRMEACLARSARAVLATTSEEAAALRAMGLPRAAVTVVPSGVDTGEFTPEGPVAKRTSRPRLLAVARLGEPQGLDALLPVLARVPSAELVIAGGPARSQLRTHEAYLHLTGLAERLGVADRLSFTGKVAPEGLPALLRSADMLVSTAPYDPSGAIAIAAMACGTPVAAVAVGACADAVLDGTTGILVPPGSPAQLARRIRDLLASPLRLEAYGIAAADRAGARYSWDRISREIVSVYERCLRPETAPAAALAGADAG